MANKLEQIRSLAQACIDERSLRLAVLEDLTDQQVAQLREDSEYENLDSFLDLQAAIALLSDDQKHILSAIAESGLYPDDSIEQRVALNRVSAAINYPDCLVLGINRAFNESFDVSLFDEGE